MTAALILAFAIVSITISWAALRTHPQRGSRNNASMQADDGLQDCCSAQDVCEKASQCLAAHVVLLSGNHHRLRVLGCYPHRPRFETVDKIAMHWAMRHCVATGRGTGLMGGSDWRFEPVITGGMVSGLMAIIGRGATEPVPSQNDWVLENVLRAAGNSLHGADLRRTAETSAEVALFEADHA